MAWSTESLTERIDALLPQTQCTRCGYPACAEYARAIAIGEADINRCPPGGAAGIAALAGLLGRAPKPLDPTCGTEQPRAWARIDEDACIGCTKCIQVCPVDAILGAAQRMHTVLTAECSGCELCLPACPVDCIDLVPAVDDGLAPDRRAAQYRARFLARRARLARLEAERQAELAARKASLGAEAVRAAIARARERQRGDET